MARVLVPLAEGCEELEAVTVIDLLRRAGVEVVSAGLQEGLVRCSRGTRIMPDADLDAVMEQTFDMIVLPGGQPGANHLDQDARVHKLLREMAEQGRYTAAICAAPKVLASSGLLDGRTATSFPGVLAATGVTQTTISEQPVVCDGTVVTSRGPGTAMDFALTLIGILCGEDKRHEVEQALVRP